MTRKARITMPNSLKCKIKHLCHNGTITERERDRILKALEQEPCEDAVSREAVNKAINDIRGWINNNNRGSAVYFIVDKIEEIINGLDLLSVQPERAKADVLDEIRAEIPKLTCGDNEYRQALVKVADVIKCIDKHRAEVEPQESEDKE